MKKKDILSKPTKKEGSIIFHHHEKVYKDENGGLWISSTLGLWLDELAIAFDEFYFLSFVSPTKTLKHDHQLNQANVQWINLGLNKGYIDFFSKRKRISAICKNYNNQVDYLFIRGFTPFQNKVWFSITPRKKKGFLLVRSLKQPRQVRLFSPITWVAYLANKLREFQFRNILKSDAHLFSNSKEVIKELEEVNGKKAFFSTTNVLKRRNFEKFDFRRWESEFNILFVGRVSTLKGVNELLEGFIALCKENPSIKIKLDLIGDVEVSFKKKLEEQLANSNLLSKVSFHGRVSFGEKLFDFYKRSHLFVLPSYTEGFPRVIWESALFSNPIIVTNVGGIPDLIKHEKHALLINPRDSNSLFDAMKELMNEPDKAKVLAKNAYELALEYTLESGIEVISKVLRS